MDTPGSQAVGFPCPTCDDLGPHDVWAWVRDDAGYMEGVGLYCRQCEREWSVSTIE